MNRLLTIIMLLLSSSLSAQWWTLGALISDTLAVQLVDSGAVAPSQATNVFDHRLRGGNYLGIRQINKLRYIPVDQYLLADYPLADVLQDSIELATGNNLVIEHLDIQYKKGWRLNGYTYETDSTGRKINDWQWAVRVKKVRKEPVEQRIARMINTWMEGQQTALASSTTAKLSPRRYRRQIVAWTDIVYLYDGGYIVDIRFSLPYPNDQQKKYKGSFPSMYYRRSIRHESIAVGGGDSQNYIRLSDSWVLRQNRTFHFGVNRFESEYYDYVHWSNIFLLNIGLSASIEYRPPYLRGFFWGAGLHAAYNILPDLDGINQFTGGLLISAGVMLP